VIDIVSVFAGDALARQRLAHAPREVGQFVEILE